MSKINLKSYFDKIYFCSGARNESLIHLFESKKDFILDERVASFMAIGEARTKRIAVCTTSGTAVLECLPAICEAFYSGIEITLITADRPSSLKNTAAPQTIDQISPLTNYVHHQYDIDYDAEQLENFDLKKGINHINIRIGNSSSQTPAHFDLKKYSKTLFLFSHGDYDFSECYEVIKDKTDYFYFEILSNQSHKNLIANERELLKLFESNAFDSVVRIGHTPLSKLWRILDERPLPCIHIDSRGFSGLSYGEVLKYSQKQLVEFLTNYPMSNNKVSAIQDFSFSKYQNSQFHFIKELSNKLNDNSHIYLGNSSIIRDFEVAYKKPAYFYGNRGANGIDGQIASAIGIAKNLDNELFICIGDLTFEYDWGSLKYLPENCKLIIFNNGGGRIFERIGIQSEIILEHAQNYQKIAQVFDLTYSLINNTDFILNNQINEFIINNKNTLTCFEDL